MFRHFVIPVLIYGKDSTESEKYAYVDSAMSLGYTKEKCPILFGFRAPISVLSLPHLVVSGGLLISDREVSQTCIEPQGPV